MIKNTVEYVEGFALQYQAVVVGQIMDAASKDVVFRNDFLNIKVFERTLQTVRRSASVAQNFRYCLLRFQLECGSQFSKQHRHMIVQRRYVELTR